MAITGTVTYNASPSPAAVFIRRVRVPFFPR